MEEREAVIWIVLFSMFLSISVVGNIYYYNECYNKDFRIEGLVRDVSGLRTQLSTFETKEENFFNVTIIDKYILNTPNGKVSIVVGFDNDSYCANPYSYLWEMDYNGTSNLTEYTIGDNYVWSDQWRYIGIG